MNILNKFIPFCALAICTNFLSAEANDNAKSEKNKNLSIEFKEDEEETKNYARLSAVCIPSGDKNQYIAGPMVTLGRRSFDKLIGADISFSYGGYFNTKKHKYAVYYTAPTVLYMQKITSNKQRGKTSSGLFYGIGGSFGGILSEDETAEEDGKKSQSFTGLFATASFGCEMIQDSKISANWQMECSCPVVPINRSKKFFEPRTPVVSTSIGLGF